MTAARHSQTGRAIGHCALVVRPRVILRRWVVVSFLAVAPLAGCGGSASKTAIQSPSPRTTTTTTALNVSGAPTGGAWEVLAQGIDSGVHWVFSQTIDPSLGTCRAFDSDPPLTGQPSERFGPPTQTTGTGDQLCETGNELKPPSTGSGNIVIGSPTVAVFVTIGSSANGDFSAAAGATAPGVASVTLHYPDGTDSVVKPSLAHTFVVISRPAKPHPSSFGVGWPGGHVVCQFLGSGPNYECAP